MYRNIRCDEESKKFYKIFLKLNNALNHSTKFELKLHLYRGGKKKGQN